MTELSEKMLNLSSTSGRKERDRVVKEKGDVGWCKP